MIDKWEKLPVFKKALEIRKLIGYIVESVEKTDIDFENDIEAEMIKNNLNYLTKNALIIPAKIAGASDESMLYDIKMENAVLIRKCARELLIDIKEIEMYGFKDIEYLDLLRQEVEVFRILFAEWVKAFDCWNYTIDRWGLFNPPGVSYNDTDPDDHIPFNPDGF